MKNLTHKIGLEVRGLIILNVSSLVWDSVLYTEVDRIHNDVNSEVIKQMIPSGFSAVNVNIIDTQD